MGHWGYQVIGADVVELKRDLMKKALERLGALCVYLLELGYVYEEGDRGFLIGFIESTI